MQNTRIAPSPTGYFHIGTARTAYHNWLVAKATGGKFILRIDDTDLGRSNDDYVKVIYDCMDWLGLDYDTTFRQSQRFDVYRNYANDLLDRKLAYQADNGAILFQPSFIPDSWVDSIAGKIDIKQDDIDLIKGMVLIKSDGTPTYNFCSIVDDVDYGVNRIIRGVDHIKNTVKQLSIAFTKKNVDISFTHVGLIHNMNGKKISKRDGALSVMDYRDQGIHPDALLNLMLRMGWSPRNPNFDSKYKKVDKDLAVKILDDGKFQNSPSKLDMSKLNFYNKLYK
jgi:glutamyl-tRNA synthetase